MMNIETKIASLGLVLPPAPPPGGVYRPVLISGNHLYVSGQGPVKADGSQIIGIVGDTLSLEQGYAAARQVGLTMLSTIQEQLGGFNGIERVVKVLGMVNSAPGFKDHPKVINGFSELMMSIWGEDKGVGARSAVGMILPGHIAVEVEAIFELKV